MCERRYVKTVIKKGLVFGLLGILILCMASCGSKDEAADEKPVVGGWEVSSESGTKAMKGDVRKAFDKAAEKSSEKNLEPLAVIYEQVVSGMNYQVLCRSKSEEKDGGAELIIVDIYKDLNGGSKIIGVKDLHIEDYAGEKKSDGKVPESMSDENRSGGWAVPEKQPSCELPDDAESRFSKAMENDDSIKLEPVAYLGERTKEDVTEYAILCSKTAGNDHPVKTMNIVIIGEDKKGDPAIDNICAIDPEQEMVPEEDLK